MPNEIEITPCPHCGYMRSYFGEIHLTAKSDCLNVAKAQVAEWQAKESIAINFYQAAMDRAEKAEAEVAALSGQLSDMTAERGVLLNGYEMVARYALPYFEKADKDYPSVESIELVHTCLGAIKKRTNETNRLAVEWMEEMRNRLSELKRLLETMTEDRDSESRRAERFCAEALELQTRIGAFIDAAALSAAKELQNDNCRKNQQV